MTERLLDHSFLEGNYPNLARVYPEDFISSLRLVGSPEHDVLVYQLRDPDERFEPTRAHLERLICFAEKYDVIDEDLLARLMSRSRRLFVAALTELSVGWFFDERGFELSFHPKGREGRTGEFEIPALDRLFVEVKCLFPGEADTVEDRLTLRLVEVAESIEMPFLLWIKIKKVSNNFSQRSFKAFLNRELSGFLGLGTSGRTGALGTLSFNDKSGLEVELTVNGAAGMDSVGCIYSSDVKSVDSVVQLRNTLKKAYSQLPDDGRPALVVLDNHMSFPVGERQMLNALYGSLQFVIGPQGFAGTWNRAPDGFFGPRRHQRLSAVGLLLRDTLRGDPTPTGLDFYHHELARTLIDWTRMRLGGLRHLVRIDDSTLGWKACDDG